MNWMVREILARNKGYLPPLKSQQSYNVMLKRLCRRTKINDQILYERTEGLKVIRKRIPKWQLISSHTARRSFATNLYLHGVPAARIMLLTGHTTEQSFFRYIRITKDENARVLSELPVFTGSGNSHPDKTPTFEDMDIAGQIRELRRLDKMTQQELADRLDCSVSAIRHCEQGIRLPSIDVLQKIAAIFSVKLDIRFVRKKK